MNVIKQNMMNQTIIYQIQCHIRKKKVHFNIKNDSDTLYFSFHKIFNKTHFNSFCYVWVAFFYSCFYLLLTWNEDRNKDGFFYATWINFTL